MQSVDLSRPLPFHLERLKGHAWLYQERLESLDWVMNMIRTESRTLDLFDIANDHLALASKALHSAAAPARAFEHLQQMHYLGIKGYKRKLMADGDTLSVKIPADTLVLKPLPADNRFLSYADWTIYFWSAVLHDQYQDMTYLVSIKEADNFNWELDPPSHMMSDILAGFFRVKAVDVAALIQDFVSATEFGKISTASYDHVANVTLPTIDVMLKIFGGAEEVQYRQAMYLALQSHDKFYSLPRMAGHSVGDISLPLSALAKLAYRKFGYTLGFYSDYVPEVIYQIEDQAISFESLVSLEPTN